MSKQQFMSGVPASVIIDDVLARVLRNQTGLPAPTIQSVQEQVRAQSEERLPQIAPKSPMSSITVWSGFGGIMSGAAQVYMGYKTGNTEAFYTGAMSILAGVGAIFGRIRADRVVSTS